MASKQNLRISRILFPVQAFKMGVGALALGRSGDPTLTLAPFMHEFDVDPADWNAIAMGTVAGDINECGAQTTGGNFTRWKTVPDLENIGYPVVTFLDKDSFEVSKMPGTGGLVSNGTVTSQLLYELGDPARYLSADVTANFSTLTMEELGDNRVGISGVEGTPSTPSYKVAITYRNGYECSGMLFIRGPDVREKCDLVKRKLLQDDRFDALVERLGDNGFSAGQDSEHEPDEVVLRFSVYHDDQEELQRDFADEFYSTICSSVPGITYMSGSRPMARDRIDFWPALLHKSQVDVDVSVLHNGNLKKHTFPGKDHVTHDYKEPRIQTYTPGDVDMIDMVDAKLRDVIFAAVAGDKGKNGNTGLQTESKEAFDWAVTHLTPDFMHARFADYGCTHVERFLLPNLPNQALNYIMHNVLDSRRADAQGKGFGEATLDLKVQVPRALVQYAK